MSKDFKLKIGLKLILKRDTHAPNLGEMIAAGTVWEVVELKTNPYSQYDMWEIMHQRPDGIRIFEAVEQTTVCDFFDLVDAPTGMMFPLVLKDWMKHTEKYLKSN